MDLFSDAVEWQGLSDVMSNGGDWSDYAYIWTIDLKTGKICRFTDSTWSKKQIRSPVNLFNIMSILTPAETKKILEDEGHCTFYYDKDTNILKVLRRHKNSHVFCDPCFWPFDTPATIRSKFCCPDCVFEYGEDLAQSCESPIRPGLMTEIYRCILSNIQLEQLELGSYVCSDESCIIANLIENNVVTNALVSTITKISDLKNNIINKIGDIIFDEIEFKIAIKNIPFWDYLYDRSWLFRKHENIRAYTSIQLVAGINKTFCVPQDNPVINDDFEIDTLNESNRLHQTLLTAFRLF